MILVILNDSYNSRDFPDIVFLYTLPYDIVILRSRNPTAICPFKLPVFLIVEALLAPLYVPSMPC